MRAGEIRICLKWVCRATCWRPGQAGGGGVGGRWRHPSGRHDNPERWFAHLHTPLLSLSLHYYADLGPRWQKQCQPAANKRERVSPKANFGRQTHFTFFILPQRTNYLCARVNWCAAKEAHKKVIFLNYAFLGFQWFHSILNERFHWATDSLRKNKNALYQRGSGTIYDSLYCQSRPTNNTFTWTGARAREKRIQPKTLELNYVALFSALAGRVDLICRPVAAATRFAVIYTCHAR